MITFTRRDVPTIMDGLVVRYQCGDFEISASRNGVLISGTSLLITDGHTMYSITNCLHRAYMQWDSLKREGKPIPEDKFAKEDLI